VLSEYLDALTEKVAESKKLVRKIMKVCCSAQRSAPARIELNVMVGDGWWVAGGVRI
jgi:hypothetical protein